MPTQSNDWHHNREATVHLPASGGEGLEWMVWSTHSELSINIVRMNKPKMLRGLSQNGDVAGTRSEFVLVMGNQRYRWTERT